MGKMLRIAVFGMVCMFLGINAMPAIAKERMVVQGYHLIYDLSISSGLPDSEQTILPEDHILLAGLLMEHPELDTVVVSGGGGVNWPAHEMANKIEAFGLNTIAKNTCSSACTTILLAGRERSMHKGSRLGFHRTSNSADHLREVYASLRGNMGWKDEFAFANYIFEQGQVTARSYIESLVRRGVDAEFALRVLTYGSNDMWYPSEEELLASGVLTRLPKTEQEERETP
jgi:hypothetical protein